LSRSISLNHFGAKPLSATAAIVAGSPNALAHWLPIGSLLAVLPSTTSLVIAVHEGDEANLAWSRPRIGAKGCIHRRTSGWALAWHSAVWHTHLAHRSGDLTATIHRTAVRAHLTLANILAIFAHAYSTHAALCQLCVGRQWIPKYVACHLAPVSANVFPVVATLLEWIWEIVPAVAGLLERIWEIERISTVAVLAVSLLQVLQERSPLRVAILGRRKGQERQHPAESHWHSIK